MTERLYSLLGGVVIQWSRVEGAILQDTSTMFQYPIVQALASEPPRSFKKKLELWRRATRTLYNADPYQQLARAICSRAKAASKLRNHLIHGSWALEDSDGAFTVSNIKALRYVETWESIPVSEALIEALRDEVRAIHDLLMSLIVSKMLHADSGRLQATPAPPP
jgi:hypothetical protein